MTLLIKFVREYWPLAVVFVLCLLAFALQGIAEVQGTFWMDPWMMVPADVTANWQALLSGTVHGGSLKQLATLLSYAFLHADVEHILMNLLFIWVFGSLVLRELGSVWFFVTYVLTAITGGIGQVLLEPSSAIPTLGASGALMGLEGIYLAMARRWRLPNPDVWPLAHPVPQERLVIFAGLGIFMDVSGILGNDGGVAFGAHIGGFIGGLMIGTTFIPRSRHAR